MTADCWDRVDALEDENERLRGEIERLKVEMLPAVGALIQDNQAVHAEVSELRGLAMPEPALIEMEALRVELAAVTAQRDEARAMAEDFNSQRVTLGREAARLRARVEHLEEELRLTEARFRGRGEAIDQLKADNAALRTKLGAAS